MSRTQPKTVELHTSCGTKVIIRDGVQVCPRCEIENPFTRTDKA